MQPWLRVVPRWRPVGSVNHKYDKFIGNDLNIQPRWGYPEDVGKAAASLSRGDLPFPTGQAVMVDGGLVIPRLVSRSLGED
jgi:3-oxoacyl-[acyl-carrier protein] reductase